MNAAVRSVAWHGLAITSHTESPKGWPFEILRASRFGLIGAERLEDVGAELPSVRAEAARFEASRHLMPHLVDLPALSAAQRGAVLNTLDAQLLRDEQPALTVLLQTDADASALLLHLRYAQTIQHADNTGWLRLHDPYVLLQLGRVFNAAGLRRVFGPVTHWHVCLAGTWHSLRPLDTEDAPSPALGKREWQALLRSAAVSRALIGLGWRSLPLVLSHSDHLDTLALRAADRHGLGTKEQADFAMLGAHLRPEFDEHPALAEAIERHRLDRQQREQRGDPDDQTLCDALRALPEPTWQDVRTRYTYLNSAEGNA